MSNKLDARSSQVIEALRFPLIYLVLFIHATLWTHVAGDPQAPGERAFKYVTDLFSFNLGRVAVPAFFVLSGFFFFWSLDLNEYKFSWFFTQWKKRIRSLLVPYLIWNLLMVIAIFVKNALFIRMGFGADECYGYIRDMDVPEWFWGGPINYPLWYIRDLMCLSLLAPLFYYFIRYVKWGSILAIFFVYFNPFGWHLTFDAQSLFYFFCGAWLGIWNYDIVALSRKIKWPSYILTFTLLLTASYFNDSSFHERLIQPLCIFGIVALINVVDAAISSPCIKKGLTSMSKYAFFTYVIHEIYILGWTKGGLLRLLGESMPAEFARFFLIPVVVTIVCVLLYKILYKICPKALSYALGNR